VGGDELGEVWIFSCTLSTLEKKMMKSILLYCVVSFVFETAEGQGISRFTIVPSDTSKTDTVSLFIDVLAGLSKTSSHSFMRPHCESIIRLIQSRYLNVYEKSFIKLMYSAFTDSTVQWKPGDAASYLERKRTFIISWISPTDSLMSLAWMLPPKNWDTTAAYPLYVYLHGLNPPYSNPVEYMATYLSPQTLAAKSFDDGFSIYPWGRGNIWYQGIGETDIWEAIHATEALVKVDPLRQYLVGHSMGGYGAWVIGQHSADYWAAIGVYAGALWYDGNSLSSAAAQKLKDVPVYIVCGTSDGLLSQNQSAYNLLRDAGNTNIKFTTFPGGHESVLANWENMYQWIRTYSNEKITSVNTDKAVQDLTLLRNYPNPFNPETTIHYEVSTTGFVNLKVYDVLGREISTLVNAEQQAGKYQIKFGSSSSGVRNLAGGMYIAKIITGNHAAAHKMLLSK
jgi:predicted esterase